MSLNILVVDDERISSLAVRTKLERLGYTVVGVAHDGPAAIELARRHRPEVILMDIRLLGEMHGIEAADRIKEFLETTIIFMSSNVDTPVLKRARITSPVGYLIKPFQDKELFVTIETAIYRQSLEKRSDSIQRWLNAIIRNTSDALITTNERDEVLFLNARAEQLLKLDPKHTIGRPMSSLLKVLTPDQTAAVSGEVLARHFEQNESYPLASTPVATPSLRLHVDGQILVIRGPRREFLGFAYFLQPAANTPLHGAAEEEGLGNAHEEPTPSLLIVDDDELYLSILAKIFDDFEVVTHSSGAAAIEACRHRQFSAILLDLNLGEGSMDGLQILEQIRELDGFAFTPVMAVTGYSLAETGSRLRAAGFTGYVSKPFSKDEVRSKVIAAIEGKLTEADFLL